MEDKKIIELYWQRNETAILETKEKYDRYLFGIADHILHDTSENEECVNDTYLKVWNSIPPVTPTSLKGYVGKIARNHALNRLRDRTREKRVANYIAIHLEELESVVCKKSMVEELVDEYLMNAANKVAPLSVNAKALGNEEYVFGVALPQIVYSDEKKLIFYDYRGIYVYNYEEECLTGFADFKSRDMFQIQGSNPTLVEVSEDGKWVRFYNQEKKYIFHTIRNQVKEVDEYKKEDETFVTYYIEAVETEMVQGQTTYLGKDASLVTIALDYDSVDEPDELKYHHLLVKKQEGGEEKIYRLFP